MPMPLRLLLELLLLLSLPCAAGVWVWVRARTPHACTRSNRLVGAGRGRPCSCLLLPGDRSVCAGAGALQHRRARRAETGDAAARPDRVWGVIMMGLPCSAVAAWKAGGATCRRQTMQEKRVRTAYCLLVSTPCIPRVCSCYMRHIGSSPYRQASSVCVCAAGIAADYWCVTIGETGL